MREWVSGWDGVGLWARRGVATCTVAVAGFAAAVDWDGNFAVDGNLDGNYSDDNNWNPNVAPGATDIVEFDVGGIYTVNLNKTDIEALTTDVLGGNVTFVSGAGNGGTNWRPGDFTIQGAATEVTFDDLDFSNADANQGLVIRDGASADFNNSSATVASLVYGISGLGGSGKIDGSTITVDGSAGSLTGTFAVRGMAPGLGVVDIFGGSTVVSDSLAVGNTPGSTGSLTIRDGATFDSGGFAIGGFGNSGDGAVLVTGQNSRLSTPTGGNGDVGQNTSPRSGSDQLAVADGGTIEIGGTFDLYPTGEFVNTGGNATFNDTALLQSNFRQDNSTAPTGGISTTTFNDSATLTAGAVFELSAGSVDFNGEVEVFSAASFTHTGGVITFNDEANFQPTDVGFGADTSTVNTAAWNVRDNVNFAERLRTSEDLDTRSNLRVEGNGRLFNFTPGTQSDLAIGFNGRSDAVVSGDGLIDIYDDVILGQNSEGRGNLELAGNGELRVNRNGSGSNLFIGFNGTGSIQMSDASTINVGNDLVIQAANNPGLDSSFLGFDPNDSSTDTTVNVGNNLLIGTNTVGGTVGAALLYGPGTVDVGNLTRVRASGQLDIDDNAQVLTTHFTADAGATLNLVSGVLQIDGGVGEFNHGTLAVGTPQTGGDNATVRAINGAVLRTANDVELAGGGNRSGVISIDGLNTRFEHTTTAAATRVGAGGMGAFSVINGGAAELGGELVIGDGMGSTGQMSVIGETAGVASFVQLGGGTTTGTTHVGRNDSIGQLFVREGGAFNSGGDLVLGQNTTSNVVSAQALASGTGDVNPSIISVRAIVANGARSFVNADDGGIITAANSITLADGNLRADGGTVLTPQLVANTAPTRVNLLNGGVLQTAGVVGDLTNEAGVLRPDVGSGLTTNLISDLNVTGAYTQQADATLEIQIGGTDPGTDHDRLVADVVTLEAGTGLDVELVNGFMPALGDSFEIVLANGVFGTFDDTTGLSLSGGLRLEIVYGPNHVTLNTVAGFIDGDYNGDGFVSQADLDLVLLNWGNSVIPAAWLATEQFDGVLVGQNELDGVLLNWGDGTPPAFSLIPEPSSLTVIAVLALGTGIRRRLAG
ncbi:MAG: hypothetical protein AAF333_18140 [Planctomycetota bacterium]